MHLLQLLVPRSTPKPLPRLLYTQSHPQPTCQEAEHIPATAPSALSPFLGQGDTKPNSLSQFPPKGVTY